MEPVTHFLTGACIGRAGLNRKTAYATLAGLLAAEAADLDICWGFAGPVEELKHHRGITHTFWAVPIVAGVIVAAIWALDRWRARRKDPALPPPQAIHWGWLYTTALIAASTHILLDWTNNYGVRPMFPLNPRWYAGSFVFIAEPVWWVLLLLAFVMPWLFGLADREIGARKQRFRGRGWAVFALTGMLIYGCWRWGEQAQAKAMLDNTQITTERISRIALEPYPVNPFRWHAILETPSLYQVAEVNTHNGSIVSDLRNDVLYKPAVTPAVEAAKGTLLGHVFLDWGTWAVVRDAGQDPIPGSQPPKLAPGRQWTTVEFSDLRFQYSILANQSRSALGGSVYIVDGHEDAGEFMNGREQK